MLPYFIIQNFCDNLQILLLVGTKLELIIMEMAQEIQDRTTIVRGVPVVEPNNKYFWFNRPQWIILLIHFTLFQVIIDHVPYTCTIAHCVGAEHIMYT